jgi:hypothetical protein
MTRRLFGALGATGLAALVLATLLPTGWVPRTGLGWGKEHFLMYFATTTILCIASRRPFVVAVSLIVCSVFLEALQGLTPDRFPDFIAALAGMAGVISAATLVMLWNSANASFPCTMDGTVKPLDGGFKVVDANGQSLAYVYGDPRDAEIAKALTLDEARRIASNLAKLPALLGRVRINRQPNADLDAPSKVRYWG